MATVGVHGEGTVWAFTETRKDGTLRHRVRVGVTIDGKRVWRTAKDAKDAERIRRSLIEARDLERDPTRQTLGDYLRSWMAGQRELARKGRGLRERTLIGYEQLIEQRILPELGGVTLARLSKRRIQAWLNSQDGSAGTVRNAHAVLRKALEGAAGDVLPGNPAKGVELPRRSGFEGSPLTEDEVRRLLSATEGDWLGPLWRLAVVTGLREGELLGLSRDSLEVDDGDGVEPRDVGLAGMAVGGRVGAIARPDRPDPRGGGERGRDDHRPATLLVDRELVRVNGRWGFDKPKAARSLKRLALDEGTVAVLQAHLRRMTEARKPGWSYWGLLFPTPQGQPYHSSTILTEFHRACVKAGIKPRRFHDLRHTNNRLLKNLNVPKDVRQARHGHATDIMDTHYGGASNEMDRAAADALGEVVG